MTRSSVSDSQIDTLVCSSSTYTSISNSVSNSTNALNTTSFSTANGTYKTTADNAIPNSFISATALSSGCDSTAIDAKSKSCIPTGILACVSSLINDFCDSVCASNIVSELAATLDQFGNLIVKLIRNEIQFKKSSKCKKSKNVQARHQSGHSRHEIDFWQVVGTSEGLHLGALPNNGKSTSCHQNLHFLNHGCFLCNPVNQLGRQEGHLLYGLHKT